MRKYQLKHLQYIESILYKWSSESTEIQENELCLFLHTIKGTAGTIKLDDIHQVCEELLESINETSEHYWDTEKWSAFLTPLTKLVQKANDQLQQENTKPSISSDNIPLILCIHNEILLIKPIRKRLEQEGWMVMATSSLLKGIYLFHELKPDLVILAHQNEDKQHEKHQLIEQAHANFVPSMCLLENNDLEELEKLFEAGTDDVLFSSITHDEMMIRARRLIRKKAYLSKLALVDELTGGYNRKYFRQEIKKQIHDLKRRNNTFSLAMMDLDNFKQVNDEYGHGTGDLVLKKFAQCVAENSRSTDYLVRYGGEEFLLVFPMTTKEKALEVLQRILDHFSEIAFKYENQSFNVTFSSGLVEVTNTDIDLDEWIHQADSCLYLAKENGRNRIVLSHSLPHEEQSSKHLKISIVVDDDELRDMLTNLFEQINWPDFNCTITGYESGEDFLDKNLDTYKGYHVVICDGMMPRMDGIEVLQKFKQQVSLNKTIFMMLTGRKSEKDIVQALELGADDYMSKPFNFTELESRIRRLVLRMWG